MTARADIAAAVNAANLPGINGATLNITPKYRQSLTPYQGFVRLGRSARAENGFGFVDTWEIWIALPQDVAAAEEWIDTNRTALLNALATESIPLTLTPSTLVLGANSVPGLVIETAREG